VSDSESDNRRGSERVPAALVVNFRLPGREAFIERYASNVSERGIFVVTTDLHPLATPVSFELRTVDGATALKGEGRIAWTRPAGEEGAPPPGLGIAFTQLDPENRALVRRMVDAARLAGGSVPPGTPQDTAVAAWLASLGSNGRTPARMWWGLAAAALVAAGGIAGWVATRPAPDAEPEAALSPPQLIGMADGGTP